MKRRHVIVIGVVIASIVMLGFLQVEAAKNLRVQMHDSTITEKNDDKTNYDLALRFENHSILPLTVGDARYSISVNGERMGEGEMSAFILAPFESRTVNSKFVADTYLVEKYKHSIEQNDSRLSGTSTYRLYLLSMDMPFDHKPSPDQIRQFFNQ